MENQIQPKPSFINNIGQEIFEGDWIAYPAGYDRSGTRMGRIKKIHTKNSLTNYRPYIIIIEIGQSNYNHTEFKIETRRLEAHGRIIKVDMHSLKEIPEYIKLLIAIDTMKDLVEGKKK